MKYLAQTLATSAVVGSALLLGCNQTTRDDVVDARNRVQQEEQRLEEVKRDANRNVAEESREAERARVTNKPIVGDDVHEGTFEERREVNRTRTSEQQRIEEQRQRVAEAKRDAAETEEQLNQEQARDKFLIDCKAAIDQANRSIEKLETEQNAATEAQQAELEQQINTIASKRDALQSKINDIRGAEVMQWSDHQEAAQEAMDELKKVSEDVS